MPPTGRYTGGAGAGTSRESGFISAPPESNVGPPGTPQSSHGSATGPIPGRTAGAAGAGQNSQSGRVGSSMGSTTGADRDAGSSSPPGGSESR
jgi:hypothetical protein